MISPDVILRCRAHQLLEEMTHGDFVIPLLDVREEGIVELLMNLVNVLYLVEDGLNLLHGQHRL